MKKQLVLFSALSLSSSLTLAQGIPADFNIFTAGEPARAQEVNDNFLSVIDLIDANIATLASNQTNIATNVAAITALQTTVAAIPDNSPQVSANTDNITTNTGNISTNSATLASNQTNIAINATAITALQTTVAVIPDNSPQVSANTSNITTNTGNISTNSATLASNQTNIATNATAITTLQTTVAAIPDNSPQVSANTGNIATNTGNISTNSATLASNQTNIATNATAITALQTTVAAIPDNSPQVSANTDNITTNASNTSTNSTNIGINTSAISSLQTTVAGFSDNSSQVTTNTDNISSNTGNISANADNITANESSIASNTSDISDNETLINGLSSRVDTLEIERPETIDYRDYLTDSSIIQKTFSHSLQSSSSCEVTTSIWDYSEEVDGSDTTYVNRREMRNDSNICQILEFRFQHNDMFHLLTAAYLYDPANPLDKLAEFDYLNPAKVGSTSMQIGHSLAGATEVEIEDFSSGGLFGDDYYTQYKGFLSHYEDVTVPYNGGTTYTNCLVREFTIGSQTETIWRCPGVGIVKKTEGVNGIMELSDMVIN